MSADLIITNARLLTMDEARPRAEAIAVSGNRIAAVGDRRAIEAERGPSTRIIDAGGATVLPGFVEGHMHLFAGAANLSVLSLEGIFGRDRSAQLVRDYAAAHPTHKLVYAVQANYSIFGDGVAVTRHELDQILSDRPLAFHAPDGHTVWANTKALEATGLLRGKRLSPGNEIVMGADGLATGELREPEAYEAIIALIPTGGRESAGILQDREPEATAAERAADREIIAHGLAFCAAQGITSIQNMDGNIYQLEHLEALDGEGRLAARVTMPFHLKSTLPASMIAEKAVGMRRRWSGERLKCNFVKIFVDGVIDSGTAFMLEDYADLPGVRGDPLFTAEMMNEACVLADKLGFQIAVHAIGDAGVRRTLDAFELAEKTNGRRDSRHRIEHIEVIHPDDIPRFRKLSVIASMQPIHPPSPLLFPETPTLGRIGDARLPYAYAWRTLKDAGARIVYASDWPVAPLPPLLSIQAAVTRKPYRPGLPDQRLSLMDSLAAYTCAGAYAEFAETEKGMLKPGYLADIAVLSGDIERSDANAIKDMTVRVTVCDGRITHEA
ncbi:MAG: amidohydrolase [Hyphomicrobiaceae bacterium]